MDSDRFAGRNVLVTGGANGIGRATVERFLAEGACVVIADQDDAVASALLKGLATAQAGFVRVDLSDPGAVVDMVETASAKFGAIDTLVNNAGIGPLGTTLTLDPEQWHRVMAINLNAIFYACRAALPGMIAAGRGAIINVASISGIRADYGLVAYNAAKGAVINYTRSLALDHAHQGIRVNSLCPGLVETRLSGAVKDAGLWETFTRSVPMRRAAQPSEMASVIAFLASDDASYITGSSIVADGGRSASTGQPDTRADE